MPCTLLFLHLQYGLMNSDTFQTIAIDADIGKQCDMSLGLCN
jgi:hypothetical protein